MKYGFIVAATDLVNIQDTLNSISNFSYGRSKIHVVIESPFELEEDLEKFINKLHYKCDYVINDGTIAEKYNDGLAKLDTDYVSFITDKYYYNDKTLLKDINNMSSEWEENEIVAIKLFTENENGLTRYNVQPTSLRNIDLKLMPFSIAMHLESYFVPTYLTKRKKFLKKLNNDCMIDYLIKLFKERTNYIFLKEHFITSIAPLENDRSRNSIQYDKTWYIDSLKKFILPLVESCEDPIPLFIQEIIYYQIYAKYKCNLNDFNKNVLSLEEFEELNNLVTQVLVKIDDNIIMQNRKKFYYDNVLYNGAHLFRVPKWLKTVYFDNKIKYIKSKRNISLVETSYGKSLCILNYKTNNKINSVVVKNTIPYKVNVYALNYEKGNLVFDCTTNITEVLKKDEFQIYVKYNDEFIEIKDMEFYNLNKCFGKSLARNYSFRFEIPMEEYGEGKIEVYALYQNQYILLKFNYSKVHAKLNNSKRSFWKCGKFILFNKVNHILIKKSSFLTLLKAELYFDLSKIKNERNTSRAIKLVMIRLLYYITKPVLSRKKIWLTWDKLYKAGDNGEYMFKYCLSKHKNIYYVIKRDSLDYKRLKRKYHGRIIIFNSLKAKLYALHAEALLKTHANVISYCGFDGIARPMVSGLFNAEVIEITHGLTIQEIAHYQNRLFDNIKLYFCASPYEVKNMQHPIYSLSDEQISLSGMARFDGLKSNDQKIVLITPTWRRNIVNTSIAYNKKTHNDNFINSDYYKIYNGLINNKKLIDTASKYGYRIIYLLHPAMSSQIDDYEAQDGVELIAATGDMNYEKILTESSLMITDYSGVQFDFAYQKKPIIYYHPSILPPHYDTGIFDYPTMGFGPVCDNEKDLVDCICKKIENDCEIDEEYKTRIKKFFKYDDFNNCERIYNRIQEYLDSKKEV